MILERIWQSPAEMQKLFGDLIEIDIDAPVVYTFKTKDMWHNQSDWRLGTRFLGSYADKRKTLFRFSNNQLVRVALQVRLICNIGI